MSLSLAGSYSPIFVCSGLYFQSAFAAVPTPSFWRQEVSSGNVGQRGRRARPNLTAPVPSLCSAVWCFSPFGGQQQLNRGRDVATTNRGFHVLAHSTIAHSFNSTYVDSLASATTRRCNSDLFSTGRAVVRRAEYRLQSDAVVNPRVCSTVPLSHTDDWKVHAETRDIGVQQRAVGGSPAV